MDGVMVGGLAKKLAAVMGAVKRIPKTGRNEFHKYDYATEADIVAAIRDELASRHIVLVPAVLAWKREPVGEKGEFLTSLDMEFMFIDGETGEMVTRPWLGVGADKSDKGAYKAMTGGEKYFLLKTFLVPTGDDPEAETEQPRRAAAKPAARPTIPGKPPAPPGELSDIAFITKPQQKRFFAISAEHGWKTDELKALLKRVVGVESTTQIPTHRYDELVKLLESGVDSMANAS